MRQIGRELGVRYILEGSVRRSGDGLRIMAQLVDTTSGAHIWADRFDGDAGEVFALQDRITGDVVGAIEPKLQLAEIERLRHKHTHDLDAYELLLRAHALEYEFTEQSMAQALAYLDQALKIDPAYAPAMALAAFCRAERHMQGWSKSRDADVADALRLARGALALGSEDAGVLWMTAFALRVLGGDPPSGHAAGQSFPSAQPQFGDRAHDSRVCRGLVGEHRARIGATGALRAAEPMRSPRHGTGIQPSPGPISSPGNTSKGPCAHVKPGRRTLVSNRHSESFRPA